MVVDQIRLYGLDPRGRVSLTRHVLPFDIDIPTSTKSRSRYPDKTQLRETIFLMRQDGMRYREIGHRLGIDASRVWQLLKTIEEINP